MKKQPLQERFQQLAGLKPLYKLKEWGGIPDPGGHPRGGTGPGTKVIQIQKDVNTGPGKTEPRIINIENPDTLDNVTIRWRGSNYRGNEFNPNLEFEPEFPETHEEEPSFAAISEDSRWLFIVDVDEETNKVDWNTLIIDSREEEQDDGSYAVNPEDMVEQAYMGPSSKGFDAGLKAAGGFSDEEFDDITSRDIEAPFPGTDNDVSNGHKAAVALIDELRYITYKKLSDEELDEFSKEMIEHFLDNTAAQAAAKIWFGKKGL